ncbi:hypothetical protein SS41_23260 [Enterobacter hormaechei subsp. xiangfangensis]|uniref:IS3 family transposase n=1 Tax=Enterobacter hormaechei TaxID=158836 RepID=UPI0005EF8147|nr:IS3 family transposase [Enterobacter hormaechei]KJN19176.1 hypothetical protein SS41_23260 [Enterobacter hormaechei subsp. xiangfangensis]
MEKLLASQMKEYFNADFIFIIDQPLAGKTTYLNYLKSVFEEFDDGIEDQYALIDDFNECKISASVIKKYKFVIATSNTGSRISGNVKYFHSLEQAKKEIDDFIFIFNHIRSKKNNLMKEINNTEYELCKKRL